MLMFIVILLGAIGGALLDSFLGIHIVTAWKQMVHVVYYMALGAVISNA